MKRPALAIAALLLFGFPSVAAPTADLHDVKWFVHTDLIGGGMDLPFYEALIDAGLEDARIVIEGNQGPADTVCCNQLEKEEHSPGVTLATFGSPGDGLDVMDSGDFATMSGLGGSGTRAFLIDSINDCGGSSAIGCAELPSCDGTPDDDPDLILVVTMDAEDSGLLGLVIAHERGHNACLVHVTNTPCELMRSTVAGGCLSPSECDSLSDARQSSGGSCACLADVPMGSDPEPAPDGDACTDGPISGVCSGGMCGETLGDAGVRLLAVGGPGAETGQPTDQPLPLSGLTGGWEDGGDIGASLRGLAYDPDADVLYGIQEVVAGDDVVVEVDPETGATSNPQTVTGHADLLALAFDPGPTTSPLDDRLLALSSDGSFEDLIDIDPSDGSSTFIGGLSIGVTGNFQGLAYDSQNEKIFVAGFGSSTLYEIDTSTCPFFCTVTAIASLDDVNRMDPSLAYSRDSCRLYMVGRQSSSRILYDTFDANSFDRATTIGLDVYTIGGLSALPVPVPEPAVSLGMSAGIALLSLLARHSGRRKNSTKN